MGTRAVPIRVLAEDLSAITVLAEDLPAITVASPQPAPKPARHRYGCKVCPGAGFNEADDFRDHHQSPWHTRNLQASLRGRSVLSEAEFMECEQRTAAQGTAAESDWDSQEEADETEAADEDGAPQNVSEKVHFSFRGTSMTVYRTLLFSTRQDYRSAEVTAQLLRSFVLAAARATWAIFLVRSGRVFAAIYDLATDAIVASKSFKRYTERAKQGGSQLLRDKSGQVARSAGSQIRRANEQALLKDVAGLLQDWSGQLGACQLVFWNRNFFSLLALFQAEGVLARSDPRLRTLPFSTYKPGLDEAQRCIKALSNAFRV